MQIERNSYKQVSNTTNTKEGTDGQTWKRLKRIEIVVFKTC